MNFNVLTPCANCPFRREGFLPLRAGRVQDIAAEQLKPEGKTFACHKTTQGRRGSAGHSHCAGALLFQKNNKHETQLVQIAQRLGMLNTSRLSDPAAVFTSLPEMVQAHAEHIDNV
jgi:hypothetical protein